MSVMPPSGPGNGFGAPQYGAPQYGAPQYGAPQYGSPQYGSPHPDPALYGAPQYGAPQPNSPQFGAPPPGYPPPPMAPNPAAYTDWFTRVLAYLIDAVPIVVAVVIGYFIIIAAAVSAGSSSACSTSSTYSTSCRPDPSGGSLAAMLFGLLIMGIVPLAYGIWNFGYKQGTTGQSIGKRVMKFQVIGENTGQPIGFGMSVVRQLAHLVDGLLCNVGYLWPLWDVKRQTLADKIMSTVCVPARPQQLPQPGAYPRPY